MGSLGAHEVTVMDAIPVMEVGDFHPGFGLGQIGVPAGRLVERERVACHVRVISDDGRVLGPASAPAMEEAVAAGHFCQDEFIGADGGRDPIRLRENVAGTGEAVIIKAFQSANTFSPHWGHTRFARITKSVSRP